MQIYLALMTSGCLLYYMVIRVYTRRWRSTFSSFWLIAGLFHLILGLAWMDIPSKIRVMILCMIIAAWILFAVVELRIVSAMKQGTEEAVQPEYLIVLGAQVRGRRITNSLMRRLDTAYEQWKRFPEIRIIVSGGRGKGEEISEAVAMAGNLQSRGIPGERIFLEGRSTTTYENLMFSKKYIRDMACPVILVTNNFHIYRALSIGKAAGYKNLYGAAASSNPVLFVNYMVREFFAVLLTKIRAMI